MYINIVIKVCTNLLSCIKLIKEFVTKIENELGRKRSSKKCLQELCDIDIIDYDQKSFRYRNIKI